ncbi:MAG TPA: cytidine deaminase [Pirellulales bacterium]
MATSRPDGENLTDAVRTTLVSSAVAARQGAYARYSKFSVGAAILAADGTIVCGANVENASYGLTICAERVAIHAAVAAGHRQFQALAVATLGGLTPCGACRQVVAEFCEDLPILLVDTASDNAVSVTKLSVLLPNCFRLQS